MFLVRPYQAEQEREQSPLGKYDAVTAVARDSHKRQPAQLDDVQVRPVWALCEALCRRAGYV